MSLESLVGLPGKLRCLSCRPGLPVSGRIITALSLSKLEMRLLVKSNEIGVFCSGKVGFAVNGTIFRCSKPFL